MVKLLFQLTVIFVTAFCEAAQRPNIILMVADDLGWNDVGFHGSEIKTPNIDQLAYSGVILNNYYVSPICTPTRGALMTGRHPIHLGIVGEYGPGLLAVYSRTQFFSWPHTELGTRAYWFTTWCNNSTPALGPSSLPYNNGTAPEIVELFHTSGWKGLQHYVIAAPEPWGLPLNFTTMGEHLKGLGYETHLIGKWHLGFFKEAYLPTRRGFDTHYGYWNGKEDYYNHLDIDGYSGLDFRHNMDVVNHTGYSTELYTKRALQVIQDHDKSKPLFMYLAYQAVHAGNSNDPIQAPQKYIDRHPDIKNIKRRKFAGVVSALDDSIGEVIGALLDSGMMNNTIIVFSTDNGGPADNYDKNAACNYPLRGIKNTMWEGGVHGVGFINSPFLQKPGTKSNNTVHVSDWLPTLYSAAGGMVSDLGELDGLDLWQMLKIGGENVRTEILHNIDPISKFSSIRVEDYKLVQGDISGGRHDSWYPCDPPEVNNTDNSDDPEVLRYTPDIHIIHERSVQPEPYRINCGPRPENYTTNCQPQKSPCLFHIPSDPCEYNNIAELHPDIVAALVKKIQGYAMSAVKPVNKGKDPRANPANFNGVWTPWE